ncbi:MAG: TetR/AcrR family transcriptional regulator [Eubacteriales bacterium]
MTKETIKKEALILFVKNGYEGTSMAEIAKMTKIRTSSIYAHFESKEQLFLNIFKETVDERLDELNEIRKNYKGTKEFLKAFLDHHLRQIETNRDKAVFFKRNVIFPPGNLKEKTKEIVISYEERLTKLLEPTFSNGVNQGVLKKNNTDKLVNMFYCVADGLYILSHYHEITSYKRIVSEVWDLFWNSIKKEKQLNRG